VRRLTGGYGVHAAFDFVGGAMKRLCFDVVAVEGHVVSGKLVASVGVEGAARPAETWVHEACEGGLRASS
jgi:NADPH:quinone reductase-like Zn-dependent oxidoreductase